MKITDKPSNAVRQTGGAGIGALVAIILGWAATQAGYSVPPEVMAAVGALIGSGSSEIAALIDAYLNGQSART